MVVLVAARNTVAVVNTMAEIAREVKLVSATKQTVVYIRLRNAVLLK